jgi:hypothetical protein
MFLPDAVVEPPAGARMPRMRGTVEIEARPYGPGSSDAERQALRGRVSLLQDRLVLFRAVPVPTPFQLDLSFDRIEELTEGLPSFALIIDLTDGRRPSAEVRAHLRERFSRLKRLCHTSVVVGPSFVLTVAARFVLRGAGLGSLTFDRRYEGALEAARRAVER